MKKGFIVLLTMLIETVLVWGLSIFIGWGFVETIFLGGLLIFAILWLFLYFTNHNQNIYYSSVKGITGMNAGAVKVFSFSFSPIIFGLILFMILSLVFTFIYYYNDFTGI